MGTQEKTPDPRHPRDVSRDDVVLSANRCPFCHTEVSAEATEALACRACLARHHGSCWHEAGACSACGGVDALTAAPPRSRLRAVVAGVAVLALAALAAVLFWPSPSAVAPERAELSPPPQREYAPPGTIELAPVQWTTVPVRGLERLELGVGVVGATPATTFQLHDSAGRSADFSLVVGESRVVTLLGHAYRVRFVRPLPGSLGERAVVWITPLG